MENKWRNPLGWFNTQQNRDIKVPVKVFVANDGPVREYSEDRPAHLRIGDHLDGLFNGFYGAQNFLSLFYSLPEIFAPVHEIASRVADCNWQLLKTWNDEVDFGNARFNKLFEQANPLQPTRELIYQAVVYEILTGRQLFYLNRASFFDDGLDGVLSWFNLPADKIKAVCRPNVLPYDIAEISDYIQEYRLPLSDGKYRRFDVDSVLPIIHYDLEKPFDLNCAKAQISGAERAIRNLIPVYEARGVIYIKRGALGMWVNKGKDANGPFLLDDEQKAAIIEQHQQQHGITGNKSPVGVSTAEVDFIRTAMSIKELEPFTETLADACAI